MGDLTDYEINKRLAKIAGVSLYAKSDESGLCRIREKSRRTILWSPLTNWSQLGPLMERFRVGIEYQGAWDAWAYNADDLGNEGQHCDPDLKRAICLAIIAAHQPDAGEEEV